MLNLSKNSFFSGNKSELFSVEQAKQARAFHSQIDGYQPTPLVSLPALAQQLGVKAILVKDESKRFGLNAFKVLGGSYALGRQLAKHLNVDIAEIDLKTVSSKLEAPLTFATATAGNHGTGVAWAAREMGQQAVVYMPKGSPQASVDRIRGLGAECIVTEVNYDDTVRLANDTAQANGWMLVQDTAWDGYEEIPTWISQGYMTMADEAVDQIEQLGFEAPSHVILQAGVGAMAGGVLGYLADRLDPTKFDTIIAEPKAADCIYRSGTSEAGNMVNVTGDLSSIMAGLACGEPNPVTWPILRDCSRYFIAVEDKVSATGMRMYGNPLAGDQAITSGESGAITLGALNEIVKHDGNVGLNEESVVLLFSTEGDTNPERYRRIVWEGAFSTSE
ncbi:Diaminopropionate ammonia-lyase [Vibrio mediterranei]|jgi:diaminopropionate ammonia-lyase|uniref:Diaminopropionate ammonia-lyase n=1 Tax=Vibrio mediterranei TaxID=689 RepID=A0ABX5DA02_9VIBR|nr:MULTISPECIES: diaminopropionate ammonia-lyase [Vibrio]EDL54744.1 diaminopropionate ammonia-lyase [Vibrio mediterranei AK1]MCG9661167.1 diaminopropionate ammonia-lyase [Vibrio mediterranei]PCD89597.1 diaminopropionate ammonia-lyase [Vibrio mediterranei]PRQ65486.1 diaminopropionate ammonia-lyase [Vibrio mediterranei]PTC04779.1 diaminopropionate ammonia-lyase [Vibrio mediterranei]